MMFGRQSNFLKDIDALLEKGFNHEQITAMLTTSPANPTPAGVDQDSGGDADPLADPPESSVAEPAQNKETPREETKPDTNAEILTAIQELKKSVQANNIKTMSVDTVDSEAALENAMAELIRPSFDKKEE